MCVNIVTLSHGVYPKCARCSSYHLWIGDFICYTATMANTILNKTYGSGSVFGYELDYKKTDVEKSDGITQCDLGY